MTSPAMKDNFMSALMSRAEVLSLSECCTLQSDRLEVMSVVLRAMVALGQRNLSTNTWSLVAS